MSDKTKKYDWVALKQEYFISDELEVKGFIRGKLGVWNANTSKQTTGWSKEKQEYREDIMYKTLEQIKDSEAAKNRKALIKLYEELRRRIEGGKVGDLIYKELEAIWKILKTEIGEPTSITKTESTHQMRESEDELTQEEREGVEKAFAIINNIEKE